MYFIALRAMVRKDLQLFLSDRRAVIMGLVMPIVIASFFGSIFQGGGGNGETAKIAIAIVDEDGSAVSKGIVDGTRAEKLLTVTAPSRDDARKNVRAGKAVVAVIIPKGFGDAAGRAFFSSAPKPSLTFWFDPSRGMELGMVRGLMTQHVMEAVSREMFGGDAGRRLIGDSLAGIEGTGLPAEQKETLRNLLQSAQRFYNTPDSQQAGGAPRGFSMPYAVTEEAVTSGMSVAYNGYAHSFAGMGAQFILFAAIDLGVGILLERQRGLWKRLRSAPLSRASLLLGKGLSGAIIGFTTMLVSFAFAIVVFKVRIAGSITGFVAIAAAYALMASAFGLLIASIGKTPGGTRGVSILATLVMVMLGGAWVPSFVFPAWLQRVTVVIPVRWAVDGLDAMTWRGLGLDAALLPTAVLLGFALVFGTLAVARFQWEA
jgi:ABC-2 type transport system permease protein